MDEAGIPGFFGGVFMSSFPPSIVKVVCLRLLRNYFVFRSKFCCGVHCQFFFRSQLCFAMLCSDVVVSSEQKSVVCGSCVHTYRFRLKIVFLR